MSKRYTFFALLITLSLILTACQQQPATTEAPAPTTAPVAPTTAAPEPSGPIKIGFMGPLTGGAAFIGVEQLGFVKAEVALFNERTGLNVEVVEGDDEINADVGAQVAEQFVADADIVGVIGPAGSQVCESTQPIFEEAGLAHITPSCTRTTLTQPGTSTFFRPIPADADQSVTDADYMVNVLGVTSVYMVDDQSSYSVGLDDELEAALEGLGATVAGRSSVTQEETDMSSVATAAIQSGADAVFFPSQIEAQEGALAVELRRQGYSGVYFLADGGFSLGWVGAAGAAAEGTYVSFFSPDPNLVPNAAEMNARYVADTGSTEFGAFGGAAGLTTQVLLEAVESCAEDGDLTRACVVAELVATDLSASDSVLGIPVSFGEGNQIQGAKFFLFQVQDGAFQLLPGDEAGVAPEVSAGLNLEPVDYEGTITIGYMGPLTGGAAFIGVEQLGFAQAVVDLYREGTGLDIQVVEGDDEINADVGAQVAEQFVANEAIVGVVGPAGSQVCESTQPIFEEAGLAHITPSCTRTTLTQPGTPTFFRPIPADADQSVTDADYMVNELGVTSVYMVDDQSSYSVGLDDELEAALEGLGATVAGRSSVTQEETDMSSVATAAIQSGADAVFFPSQIEAQEGALAVELDRQGFDGVYFLADGGFSLGWVGAAGGAADDTYVSFFSPDPNLVPNAAPMNARFVANTGTTEFGAFGGAAGLTTQVLLDAVVRCAQAGEVSRACVVEELGNTNLTAADSVQGVPVSFGEGNQIEGARFFIFQVQGGAFTLIQ